MEIDLRMLKMPWGCWLGIWNREQYDDLAEELTAVHEKNESLEKEGLSHFVHGSTSKSGAKEACQDVRLGVRQEVLQRVAVSNKPKVVHKCNNMKVRQEVLKLGCAAGTRKETDRCISNCVRPSKKQHRMCCWFCGKAGHKKVECFARENSRNMAKKEETSEDGCSSGRSDLEVDQETSSLEPGHEVVYGTKEKETEVRHEVVRDDLQEGDSEITPRQ
ncbi:hypothetical protein DY000_02014206 [Brassica cretica]|uniref:CCHC-type domain-containing protein n=1 Tax=Brassica cretica TaxID=69181 RepID=A0ABQ7D1Z7_BRACR|nr:hypothetical protein DY000_02014206 [Brassica cretica]